MKPLIAITIGTLSLLAIGVALAQNGNMMNGSGWGMGWMGGYGGGPILLVVLVVGVVVLVMQRKVK